MKLNFLLFSLLGLALAQAVRTDCPEGEVDVGGQCVPSSCVYDKEGVPTVCGGRGTCVALGDEWGCSCDDGTLLLSVGCVPQNCVSMSDFTLCSHGVCEETEDGLGMCVCSEGYVLINNHCYYEGCVVEGSDTICSDFGECVDAEEDMACECDEAHAGQTCHECSEGSLLLNGKCVPPACLSEDGLECGDHGTCEFNGELYSCNCDSGYTRVPNFGCLPSGCTSFADDGVLCDNHGDCIQDESTGHFSCQCYEGFEYLYPTCMPSACLFVKDDVVTVCSGRGACLENSEDGSYYCECEEIYAGDKCSECSEGSYPSYDGLDCVPESCMVVIPTNGSLVECGGVGMCQLIGPGFYGCNCGLSYIASNGFCYTLECVSDLDEAGQPIGFCGGHGVCTLTEDCICEPGWAGYRCTEESVGCGEDELQIDGECVSKKCVIYPGELEDPNICGGNGTCVLDSDSGAFGCQCFEGFTFTKKLGCVPAKCYSSADNALCPNGECVFDEASGEYGCECNRGYVVVDSLCVSKDCIYTTPEGVDTACNSQGECVLQGTAWVCSCNSIHNGTYCEECSVLAMEMDGVCIHADCLTEYPNGTVSQCNGAGLCTLTPNGYRCECESGAFSDAGQCGHEECVAPGGEGENPTLCSDHGACDSDACKCYPGFSGEKCEDVHIVCKPGQVLAGHLCTPESCAGYDYLYGKYEPCGNHGVCSGVGPLAYCICQPGYTLDDYYGCVPKACGYDSGDLCGAHGICVPDAEESHYCECEEGYVFSIQDKVCRHSSCFSNPLLPTVMCSGHGTCPGESCVCEEGWEGPLCSDVTRECGLNETAIGDNCIPNSCVFPAMGSDEPAECNGVGVCVYKHAQYTCSCDSDYKLVDGMGCMPMACYDVDTGLLCAHGKCLQEGRAYFCSCEDGFVSLGNRCMSELCDSSAWGDKVVECNGMGKCVESEDGYICRCQEPVTGPLCLECNLSVGHVIEGECISNSCVDMDADGVAIECGDAGICEYVAGIYVCQCDSDALPVGKSCVPKACISDAGSLEVCGGHGVCRDELCACSSGWGGELCQDEQPAGLSGGAIAGIVLGVLSAVSLSGLGVYLCLRKRRASYARLSDSSETEDSSVDAE